MFQERKSIFKEKENNMQQGPKKIKIKSNHILAFLSIICFGMMVMTLIDSEITRPVRNVVAKIVMPVQKGVNYFGSFLSDKAENLNEMSLLKEENAKLKEENAQLKLENNILIQDKSELDRLRELYDLDSIYEDYPKIAARVIGKDTSSWFSEFTIDRGKKDGIEVDMNVIADAGLVGRVTFVGEDYAKVTSIISDGNNVSAKSASNSDMCIVEGSLKLMETGMLDVINISVTADIKDGEMLMTSHISDKYLPGILIGYISNIKDDGNKLTMSAKLTPAVDFNHLEEVLVITQLK